MKNITLSASEQLIEAARRRALTEHSTLNKQFRLWLEDYVRRPQQASTALETIRALRGSYWIMSWNHYGASTRPDHCFGADLSYSPATGSVFMIA